ncbi:MAG TPA: hypothetical protein VFQ76_01795 [Longimicrobiaceae bacterium]|nr:hypothetical protein [Longimicrobiaceae bacterium]
MDTEITVKAKFDTRRQEFLGAVATVSVPVRVELDLDSDGAYAIRKAKGSDGNRYVPISIEDLEASIDAHYDSDDLAAAYESAAALNLDPDAEVESAGDDEEDYDA